MDKTEKVLAITDMVNIVIAILFALSLTYIQYNCPKDSSWAAFILFCIVISIMLYLILRLCSCYLIGYISKKYYLNKLDRCTNQFEIKWLKFIISDVRIKFSPSEINELLNLIEFLEAKPTNLIKDSVVQRIDSHIKTNIKTNITQSMNRPTYNRFFDKTNELIEFRFSQNYKEYLSNKKTYEKIIDIEKYYTS